jgi:VanZ family protein
MARPRSLAWSLAAAWACLMVYASLHPFEGWRLPAELGAELFVLKPPQPRGVSRFDLIANLLGYLPLGALLATALLRDGRPHWVAVSAALLASSGLSYAMETLQHLLPRRVPSIYDWELNSAGAALGVLAVLVADAAGLLAGWQRWRERWFLHGRGFGLALLLLWPFGLLFPPPLPFGLGQVVARLREVAAEALAGTPWDGWLQPPGGPAVGTPLAPAGELLGIVAGLLAPTLLAYTITRPGARRLALLAGALVLGVSVTTLSTALNFGPDHALAWLTRPVAPALALTAAIALPLAWAPGRAAAAVALLAISAGLALVNAAPADAYYAESLQSWEQGRFIRFHGLTQWVGWAWPWAALAYLLGRVASRREPPET